MDKLLKYGGLGMVDLLEQLLQLYGRRRLGQTMERALMLIIMMFKKVDRENPGNYTQGYHLASLL